MILQELARYYKRLRTAGVDLPEMGFSKNPIHFVLVIDPQSGHAQIDDLREHDGKKLIPQTMTVPYIIRTSGVKPAFLWDKAEYVFGITLKDKKELKKGDPNWKLTDKGRDKFDSFRKYHSIAAQETEDEDLKTLVCFLENWVPSNFTSLKGASNDVAEGNIAFQILGKNRYLHHKEQLKEYWEKQLNDNNLETITCLVTGERDELAQLHTGIKGVPGAQSSGAPVVSFNKEAFCSYGKGAQDQGKNSPVGKHAAFAYAAVLNHLLTFESRQKIQIADSTAVFWAEKDSKVDDIFGDLLAPPRDDGFSKKVETYLECVRKGAMPKDIDGSQRFYILGLSPNAARLSVRYWYVNTVEAISRRIIQHFDQLEIVRQSEKQLIHPGIWNLLIETACQHKSENIPPNLAGPFMIALLKGTPYPVSLLSILIQRMHIEKNPNYYRCSLVKAILIRNYRKEVSVSLDKDRADVAYVLGRFFALLEKLQEESAGGKLNASIKDRYFPSASTHPSVVFPILIKLSQNHQKKLKSEKMGRAVFFQKEIQSVIGMIESFPSYLKLEDQGLFAIGYYHQYQKFFEKREAGASDETETQEG